MILDLRAQIHKTIVKSLNENGKTEGGTYLNKYLRNAELDNSVKVIALLVCRSKIWDICLGCKNMK